jgi:hypothetical protein
MHPPRREQARRWTRPIYREAGVDGPAHELVFTATVRFGPAEQPELHVHTATGPSKKAAKRAAAAAAKASGVAHAAPAHPPAAAKRKADADALAPLVVATKADSVKRGKKQKRVVDLTAPLAPARSDHVERAHVGAPAPRTLGGDAHAMSTISVGPHVVSVAYLRAGVDDVDGALEALGLTRSPCLGFDIEVRPAFQQGTHFPTSVIQLSSLTHCAVVSVGRALPASLCRIVTDSSVIKFGCGIRADLLRLHADFGSCLGAPPARLGFVDLSLVARLTGSGEAGEPDKGLKRLCDETAVFTLEKPKSVVLSRWDKLPLTHAQIKYAAMDACVGIYLGATLFNLEVPCQPEALLLEAELHARSLPYCGFGPTVHELHADDASKRLPPAVRARLEAEAGVCKQRRENKAQRKTAQEDRQAPATSHKRGAGGASRPPFPYPFRSS